MNEFQLIEYIHGTTLYQLLVVEHYAVATSNWKMHLAVQNMKITKTLRRCFIANFCAHWSCKTSKAWLLYPVKLKSTVSDGYDIQIRSDRGEMIMSSDKNERAAFVIFGV